MKSPLHILHLEDNPNDVALVKSTLENEGITCTTTCVQNHDDFVAALEHDGIDLILSDFSLPEFDGLSAIKIAHTRWPTLPVILISGTLGEEQAIDSLKNGATDYVLKGHLSRLIPAVRRAMQDVDERAEHHHLEALYIEAQKMEVIGQLSSGVAHDFNNILAVIMGYSDLMMQKLGPDNHLSKHIGEIQCASERAVRLTRQLLVFSRKQIVQPIVLNLNTIVENLEKMLQRLIDENIEMKVILGKQIGHVKADSGYIGQVLMNLVINARDAMPNGGNLTISTSNITLDKNYEGVHTEVIPGDYVMLNVSDTGSGMTEEVKAHLFKAFFTTKPIGKGTGLGLATCQIIVQQSGGHIGVESEIGKGTTFKIYFPRIEQPLTVETRPIQSWEALPRGTETLLIVEDDPSVRHLACNILEAQGYGILSAMNGQDALRVARENKGSPIRLVVTDMIMPLMGGKVMAEWLKTTYPDLKILFTSGYTSESILTEGMIGTDIAFLPKPYTPAVLIRKVRKMLDS